MFVSGQYIGKYLIKGTLGSGGMAIVYRAQDTITRRHVALKYLPKEEATEEYIGRFLREAKLLAKLNHDNIVKIYDVVQQERCFCFAMELIEGTSLESIHYRTNKETGKGIPEERARPMLVDVARALAAAHVKDILHRDIKPANIMVEEETDRTVLLDFGLARGGGTQTLTKTGAVMGTLMYLAPEQIRGKKVTKATDVYQWGMVAYHLLTGHLPFEDEDDVTMAILRTTKSLPHIWEFNNEVSEEMSAIIMRCIERDPSARYADCEELYKLLAPEDFEEDIINWTCDDDPAQTLSAIDVTSAVEEETKQISSTAASMAGPDATVPIQKKVDEEGKKPPPWLAAAVVVIVLSLFGLWPSGKVSWPPQDIRISPRSLTAAVSFTTNISIPGFFYRVKGTGKEGGKPVKWEKSFQYSAKEGAQYIHDLKLNGLEPGRHYILELLPSKDSKRPPSATEFRTKVLQPSITKIELLPRNDMVTLKFKTPTKARVEVLSIPRGKTPRSVRAESDEAIEHELTFVPDAFYHSVCLKYSIGDTEWVGPELERHRLLEMALTTLKEKLRKPFINNGKGLRPRLPRPHELKKEIDDIYISLKRGPKAEQKLATIIGKWWKQANDELQKVRVLVPLYVGYQRISSEKRNALGASCASLEYMRIYCRKKRLKVSFPPGSSMPANLRSFQGEPKGFVPLPKMRFEDGIVRIYRPGPKFAFPGQKFLQEHTISPSHIPPEYIENYAIIALVIEAEKISRDFYPVVEVNGMPLYFLKRSEQEEGLVLSHTIPSTFLIPDDGNQFKISLFPHGEKNQRMNMLNIRLLGGRKR